MPEIQRRYLFQADATGVAAQFVHPFNEVVPIQAASTLPSIGGRGSSLVGEYRFKDILSFDYAYTKVSGIETADGVFETVALSIVENFRLGDAVHCDRIVGKLTGTRRGGLKVSAENFIVPSGSVFEGLKIGDRAFSRLEVAPKFFLDHASWSDLNRVVKNEPDLLQKISLAPNRDGLLGFGIALDPDPGPDFGKPLIIDVSGFGTVHLGEFFCDPSSRRLIMLRAELNGAVRGQVVVGDPIVDGQPFPP